MPNITLSITDETKNKMEKHPEVRWSNAVRTVIEKKLRDFEEAERIAGKSELSEKDVEMLSEKVNKDIAKHARGLLNESNS
jgi:predicted CopG family antitoxin